MGGVGRGGMSMLDKVSRKLATELVDNEMIDHEELEIYEYGILLILMTGCTMVCITCVGVLIHKFFFTVVFLGALVNLRHYSGGYHANSFTKCFCISCSSYGIAVVLSYLEAKLPIGNILIIASLLASCYLCKIGALNSHKNTKSDAEMKIRRYRTRFITIGYSLVSLLLLGIIKQFTDLATAIITTQIIVAGAILVTKTKEEVL